MSVNMVNCNRNLFFVLSAIAIMTMVIMYISDSLQIGHPRFSLFYRIMIAENDTTVNSSKPHTMTTKSSNTHTMMVKSPNLDKMSNKVSNPHSKTDTFLNPDKITDKFLNPDKMIDKFSNPHSTKDKSSNLLSTTNKSLNPHSTTTKSSKPHSTTITTTTVQTAKPTDRPLVCKHCFHSNFTSLIENSKICSKSEEGAYPEMIVMITCSPKAFNRRQAIRETWASVSLNNTGRVRHVFLLGTSKEGEVSEEVRGEAQQFGDMLVSDFVDAYANLTLKTLAGLHWIVRHCGQAKFFMKTDQDMYVFLDRILSLARAQHTRLQTSLGGACYQTGKPWRDPKTKYYASVRSYPQPTYPGFCSGTGYLSSLDVARKILQTSPDIPFFHLEDVYLALVMRHLGFKLTAYPGFALGQRECLKPGGGKKAMTIHEVLPKKIRKFWAKKCGL